MTRNVWLVLTFWLLAEPGMALPAAAGGGSAQPRDAAQQAPTSGRSGADPLAPTNAAPTNAAPTDAAPPQTPSPATDPPASTPATPAPPAAADSPAKEPVEFCKETFSSERARPKIEEKFPSRGTSGHVAWLELIVDHAKGEQVFPGGLSFPPDAAERKLLRAAEFELPLPESEVKAVLERTEQAGGARTTVKLPIVALPREAGRHLLVLPELPIAISRASGRVETLCSKAHPITVEDPLTSSPSLEPAPDPAPRPQRELWLAARDVARALLVALPIALLVAWLFYRFRDRFRRKVVPPPPRPPWEVALAQLDQLQTERLLEKSEYEAYLDRASDTLRQYLGARYGFEGLESTTREILRQLESRAPDFDHQKSVRQLLQRTDLVKFARQLPDEGECRAAFEEVRRIVISTRLNLAPAEPTSRAQRPDHQPGARAE